MRTQKQIEASRRNGALSRGPVTVQGKRISSQNAVIHGIYSKEVVLHTESRVKFKRFRRDYLDLHNPQTLAEHHLVDEIVMCAWRLHRHWNAESATLDTQMHELKPGIDAACESITAQSQMGLAYRASESTIANFRRIEASLSRQLAQAEQRLDRLQSRRTAKAEDQTQAQPVSKSRHPSRDREGAVPAPDLQ